MPSRKALMADRIPGAAHIAVAASSSAWVIALVRTRAGSWNWRLVVHVGRYASQPLGFGNSLVEQGEYDKLREEARSVVKATTEMIAQFTEKSAPPADLLARAKADRGRLALMLANPVAGGESREIAGRHCRVSCQSRMQARACFTCISTAGE
jgi:hypothetical protein